MKIDVCKWKNGDFKPCSGFEPVPDINGNRVICLYCEAELKKPEPEVTTEEKTLRLMNNLADMGISSKEIIDFFKKCRLATIDDLED